MWKTNISFGIKENERRKVSEILYEAFSKKFKLVFGSTKKSLRVFSRYINAPSILVARERGEIVGVAGLKYNHVNWLKLNFFDAILEFRFAIFRVAIVGFPLMASRLKGDLLLDVLAVSPKARGKGIGTKMLRFLLSFGKEEGLKKIRLYVICDNTGAKVLYERMGFTTVRLHKIPRLWRNVLSFNGYFKWTLI
jgi:ribosomal protein S18 acetylase RimI-like enzyme